MKNIKTMLCGVALATAFAAPALAFPIGEGGTLVVDVPLQNAGFFEMNGNVLFGLRFTLDVDVTQGSGYSLLTDTFGTQALSGADSELALYSGDGSQILAINDDFGGGTRDAFLGFGDADQPSNPFNGTTRQGNIVNQINLTAGTYLIVIGPFNTVWDSFDAQLTEVDNRQGHSEWLCRLLLTRVPAPGSFALLGLGTLAIGGRRRRA